MIHSRLGGLLVNQKKSAAGKKHYNNPELLRDIGRVEEQILKDGSASKLIHNFLKENAPNIGMNYSTNFSNLT